MYGGNTQTPFGETDRLVGPVSFYAATKTAGEAMVHAYSHLWNLPVTALRFFTVYGPWGRPDMALFKFVAAAERDEAIEIYGEGRMQRDFTYIDDLIEAVLGLMERPPVRGQMVAHDSLSPMAPYRVVNMGGGQPRELLVFIDAIAAALGRDIKRVMLPMQAGDVVATAADPRLLQALVGRLPTTPIEVGVAEFVAWYRAFYAE